MKRTDALFAALVSTTLVIACDPGESDDAAELLSIDDEAELVSIDDDPAAQPWIDDGLVTPPESALDQECESFYITGRSNESQRSECMLDVPAPDLPQYFPQWNNLLNNWMHTSAAATCTGLGARDGDGNLPSIGTGAPAQPGVDALAGPSGGPQAAPGALPTLELPGAKASGVTPPACQTLCQSYGKTWNPNAAHYGTCAFNKVITLDPPEHWNAGPSCPSPGTRRWRTGGDVVFDCGCSCQ